MGRRRDRLNKRREKQIKTRAANAPRKAKERARKAAASATIWDKLSGKLEVSANIFQATLSSSWWYELPTKSASNQRYTQYARRYTNQFPRRQNRIQPTKYYSPNTKYSPIFSYLCHLHLGSKVLRLESFFHDFQLRISCFRPIALAKVEASANAQAAQRPQPKRRRPHPPFVEAHLRPPPHQPPNHPIPSPPTTP